MYQRQWGFDIAWCDQIVAERSVFNLLCQCIGGYANDIINCVENKLMHAARISKSHFGFSWMDIHINHAGVDL